MLTWIRNLNRHQFGSGVHSQSYQDEILDLIFANIGTRNSPPTCVEFGFSSTSLTGGTGANVAKLVLEHGWKALLFDRDNVNPEINLWRQHLLPCNLGEVFRAHGVPAQPEYVSIDVDSTDLWLLESLLRQFRPMVVSVEYNCHFPLEAAISFPNDVEECWEGDRGYGASLKALVLAAKQFGYSLLWVVPRHDAFFIRDDLIDDGTPTRCFPLEAWRSLTGVMVHSPLRREHRASIFIDYDTYLSSGGDVALSRRRAEPICRRWLIDSWHSKIFRRAYRWSCRLTTSGAEEVGAYDDRRH